MARRRNALAQARLRSPAPRDPEPVERIYEEFRRDILPYRMGNIHPRFWAWYMGNGTLTGALGDFLAAVMNSNVGGGNHVAPMIEAQVIDWMRAMMGLPAGTSGLLTSGGSAANLIGIAAIGALGSFLISLVGAVLLIAILRAMGFFR